MIATSLADLAGIASVAVALVAIAVSVLLWSRSRQRKGVSFRLSSSRVVSVRRGSEDRIKVLYDDQPVRDVRLLDLHVVCTGNVPIGANDFERRFSVALGKGARVLSPEIARVCPPDLAPRLTVIGDRLTIEPLLLNPGDSFDITALVSDMRGAERLDGRVAGVSKFVNLAADIPSRPWIGARQFRAGATAIGVAAALATIGGPLLFVANQHTESQLRVKGGSVLCGKVLRVDAQSVVVRLHNGGLLRTLPVAQVQAINENAC
jgi:hypothetical protein